MHGFEDVVPKIILILLMLFTSLLDCIIHDGALLQRGAIYNLLYRVYYHYNNITV